MNRILGRPLFAAALSLVLAGLGSVAHGDEGGASFQDLARAIIHGQDQVGVDALADWIVQGKKDFVLVDVRPQQAFEAGHIQGAQSLPLTYLVERQTLGQLPRDRKIVLYSNGNRESSQAAVMLRIAGLDAYSLLGGYDFWTQHVLHPELPANAGDDERLAFRKQQAIACYFSGNYKGGSESPEAAAPPAGFAPPVQSAPPAGAKPQGGHKIKEGC